MEVSCDEWFLTCEGQIGIDDCVIRLAMELQSGDGWLILNETLELEPLVYYWRGVCGVLNPNWGAGEVIKLDGRTKLL